MPNQGPISIHRTVLPRLAFALFLVLLPACLDRADAVDTRPGDYLVLDAGRVLHEATTLGTEQECRSLQRFRERLHAMHLRSGKP